MSNAVMGFSMRLRGGWTLPLVLIVVTGCDGPSGMEAAPAKSQGRTAVPYVRVRLIGPDGKLTEPTETPAVVRSDAEWRKRLTPEQYHITRGKGTEPAFCSGLLDNKRPGMYVCVGCDLPLFKSKAKFESGTGWPSFFQPAAEENLREKIDKSHGMVRTEILCRRCSAHLGHVFEDGPTPTGRRYCLNSAALRFVPADQLKNLAAKAEAVLAGGCFWCVEAVFEQLDGVVDVTAQRSRVPSIDRDAVGAA